MVVEDEIRAKGLGVALGGSLQDEDNQDTDLPRVQVMTGEQLDWRYYRARFQACRSGMWFSITLNAFFIAWIAWTTWRW